MATLADILEPVHLPPLAWLASPYTFKLKRKKFAFHDDLDDPSHSDQPQRLIRWISSGRYSWINATVCRNDARARTAAAKKNSPEWWHSCRIADQFQASEFARSAANEIINFYDLTGSCFADLCHTSQPNVWAALQGKRALSDAMTYVLNCLYQGVDPTNLCGYPPEPSPTAHEVGWKAIS